MTEDNQKRLYEHYVKVGNKKNIAMMLKAYPQFADKKEETKVEKNKK